MATMEEAIEIHKKKELPKCRRCHNARWSGGPGYIGLDECELPNHTDVHYGTFCPEDCPDFVDRTDEDYSKDIIVEYSAWTKICDEEYGLDEEEKKKYGIKIKI